MPLAGWMLVQAKGYDYHWLPMLPPLALLAADSLDRVLSFMKRWGRADTLYTAGSGIAGLGLLVVLAVARRWPEMARLDQLEDLADGAWTEPAPST